MEDIFTIGEASKRLKLRPATVREWVRLGKLGAIKLGREWRVRERDLARLLEEGIPEQFPPGTQAREEEPEADTSPSGRGLQSAEGLLLALVKALLPDGQKLPLRDRGITELSLGDLNAVLERHGLVIHAEKGRDPKRLVTCTGQDGQIEQYGLFELRRREQAAEEGRQEQP